MTLKQAVESGLRNWRIARERHQIAEYRLAYYANGRSPVEEQIERLRSYFEAKVALEEAERRLLECGAAFDAFGPDVEIAEP
jgi:hypothetical protein